MNVFLISGKAQVGKNEVANIIKKYYNNKQKKTIITGFSKYIKLLANEYLNWDGTEETKPRDFLQNMGEEYRKIIGPDIFVKRMIDDLKIYKELVDNVIISDTRLKNEITSLRLVDNVNVYVIRVNKNNNSLSNEQKHHNTEIALDDFSDYDYIIDNNNSITELQSQVETMLKDVDKNES